MIIANICAAQFLANHAKRAYLTRTQASTRKNMEAVRTYLLNTLTDETTAEDQLSEFNDRYSAEKLATLEGYCAMQRDVREFETSWSYVCVVISRLLNLKQKLLRTLAWVSAIMRLGPHQSVNMAIW